MTGPGDVSRAICGVRACLARLAGAAAVTRRVSLLILAVYIASVVFVPLGLLAHAFETDRPASPYLLAIAVGTVAVSQLAVVRVRVGAARLALGWGEASLVILLYLIPAGWVPLAIFLGVTLAMIVLQIFGDRRPIWLMAYNAAALTVAGGCAALVAGLIREPYRSGLTAQVTVALIASALLYAAIAVVLVAAVASERGGTRFADVAARTFTGKLFMTVGNVTVGLIIVAMLGVGMLWLVVLPPVLWLLHQSYAYRMRVDDERRGWRIFSGATRSLNQLDEGAVAEAAVLGAVRLFVADSAEVLVLRPGGTVCCYFGGRDGHVSAALARPAVPQPSGDGPDHAPALAAGHPEATPLAPGCVVSRPLLVGGAHVGELRIRFARPIGLSNREQMQLSAFGDAVAGALHDTATHQQLQAMSTQGWHEALLDPLTGVRNRDALLAAGDLALGQLDRDAPVALLVLDINHFKEVNDTLGHVAGDELVRITATRVGGASQAGDLVGRLGGDEFGVLITQLPVDGDGAVDDRPTSTDEPGLRAAMRRARELADLLANPTEVAGLQLAVEASIGVAVARAATCDMTELLRRADIAMYQAKRGGGAVAWYDSASDVASTDRLTLLAELREALEARPAQLVLTMQPTVDLRTGAPIGLEALVRWRHPRRGELEPAEFMDVLVNSELVTPFTRYVLDEALRVAAHCAAEGVPLPVSVKLSPRSLLARSLPNEVGTLLARHRVPAERLVLEITETVVVPEFKVVTEVLAGLRALGVQLAVDDFGTAYSSLTFLTRVHVDEVKVDQTFVRRMLESPEAMAIVRTTVDLARQLNLRVVAEGVETAVQKMALAGLGCTAAQGHHFSAPVPLEKVVPALQTLMGSAGGRVIPLRAEGAS
jgi:diguanylate cyclase